MVTSDTPPVAYLLTAAGRGLFLAAGLLFWSGASYAQRANENALASADDAFGVSVGNDQIGLYSSGNVRGFSPETAGNIRIEGLSVTEPGGFSGRIVSGSVIRVGITAQNYPFPAPTGIADFSLRAAGDHALVSAVGISGPLENRRIELDGQIPIVAGRLGVAAGIAGNLAEGFCCGHANEISTGAVLHWQPANNIEIKPFYGLITVWDDRTSVPLYVTAGPSLPPRIPRRFTPLDWAKGRLILQMAGSVASVSLSDNWSIKAGLFWWNDNSPRSFQDLYDDVRPDGSAHRLVVATHDQDAEAVSGEIRSTWVVNDGPRRHFLILDAKGRTTNRAFGGSDVVDLGSADIFHMADFPKPALAFGSLSEDRVRQLTPGLGYQLVWRGVGGLSLNVQRPQYRDETTTPLSSGTVVSKTNPLLFSGNAILTPSRSLAIYGGYTTGLEEGAVAPANAVNRSSPTPALQTSQRDFGVRYRVTPALTLIAGLFDVRKPYFNLDDHQFYRQLGEERHRGVEMSLSGQLGKDLTIVGGAVLTDAKVIGEAATSGLIGHRPVGSTPRNLLLSLEWRPPQIRPLSLRVSVNNSGPTVATGHIFASLGHRQLTVPAATSIDFNGRYRFRVSHHDASLQLSIRNLLNSGEWSVAADSAFTFASERQIQLVFSIDI
ncbi:MAG TPA: TonB-dependent receptor [Sphingomicrobium sp.]|nr:TonB-dependent receptor [Sphingomicrobium sp.]